MITLETDRLILKPITLAHVEDLYVLNLDPEVVQYTGDVAFESIEATRKFYSTYDQYEKYGMGRFSTYLKMDNTFIGWCGLKLLENGDIDLGYRLMKKFWNQGYATEASEVSLDYGFNTLDVKEIKAIAYVANPASLRVMEKVGMHYHKDIIYDGLPAQQYIINRETYLARH